MKLSKIRWLGQSYGKQPLRFLIITLLVFYAISVPLLYFSEINKNENIANPWDAFRTISVLFLGEYEESLKTRPGKAIAAVALILSIAFVGTIIARIASFFVGLKLGARMFKGRKKHIVVCNWNDRGDRIIKEIHKENGNSRKDVVIITDQEIDEQAFSNIPAYKNVEFIKGDPASHDMLEEAEVEYAKSVIIMADDTKRSDPDAYTALVSLAITRYIKNKNVSKEPYIIAEVMNSKMVEPLLSAHVDECVCAAYYRLGIIAQCVFHNKISDVYKQMLEYSKDTNEIYIIDNKEDLKNLTGKSFKEMAQMLSDKRNEKNPTILLGVKRNNRIILNPKGREFDALKNGDNLIVLAFREPKLNYLTKK